MRTLRTVTARLIRAFGEDVSLEKAGETLGQGKAILRPILDEKTQFSPTPLGVKEREEMLCLAEAGLAFPSDPDGVVLRRGEGTYTLRSVRPVTAGETRLYWRAYLEKRGEEEVL